MAPKGETINVNKFMELKDKLREVAKEVYQNTDTEVILERA
jgi:hypothetical protein